MAVNEFNSNDFPGVKVGLATLNPALQFGGIPVGPNLPSTTLGPEQVIGLVPLFACCLKGTTGGTYGCVNFTITMNGDCTGAQLQLVFKTLGGGTKTYTVTVPNPNTNCAQFAEQVVAYINENAAPYTASIVGTPGSSCEVQICPPNDPAYYGATVTLNAYQAENCSGQAISAPFPTPYYNNNSNTWWPLVTTIKITIKITCGRTTWTIPAFTVPITSSAAEMTVILATLNAYFTANALPFTAIGNAVTPTLQWQLQGTSCSAQNGCTVTEYDRFYDNGQEIPNSWDIIGPSTLTGGTGTLTQLGVVGGVPQTLTMGTASTPVYDIDGCGDCRQGEYFGDSIPDDREYTLPVFGNPDGLDDYTNDTNGWLLQYPIGYDAITKGDFTLQQRVNGVWNTVATLNSNALGTPFNNNYGTTAWPFYSDAAYTVPITSCATVNYQGFEINWHNVYMTFGAGTYRFAVNGQLYGSTGQGPAYCFATNPFCLQAWDCHTADSTAKFRAQYIGGTFGDVNVQGNSWSLCCPGIPGNGSNPPVPGQPIAWRDSIRFPAFFQPPAYDYEIISEKYQTGEMKKIRDEALKKFNFRTNQVPQWLIDRFSSYALMADQLFVSDYNYNNPSYNIKDLWVVRDSSVNPKYKFESRYTKIIDLQFKEGKQYIFRDRCC